MSDPRCKCGHGKSAHIYEIGPCRPGFVCEKACGGFVARILLANVILFKPSGKYYTEEPWRIPDGAIGPYDMVGSPDFRRIGGGAVLVVTQEPWGYPHLFPADVARIRAESWDEGFIARLGDAPRYKTPVEWGNPYRTEWGESR